MWIAVAIHESCDNPPTVAFSAGATTSPEVAKQKLFQAIARYVKSECPDEDLEEFIGGYTIESFELDH